MEALKLSTPVHPIFHGIDFVNQVLREGNYFFAEVFKKAQEDFDHWFASADDFSQGFKDFFGRERYNKAAFALHQATER